MKSKFLYGALSVGFFIVLFLGVIMFTDLFFNSSSSFFDRMSDVTKIFEGLGK